MEQTISDRSKQDLFDLILSEPDPFKEDERKGIIEFLNVIWDLKSMPSRDPRFKDAERDVIQHTVNNHDWEMEYLFKDRLGLFEDDGIFTKFLETVVNPKFRVDEDEITKFVLLINSVLELDGLQLSISDYNNMDRPIYTIKELDINDPFPIGVKRNSIPFYVIEDRDSHYNIRLRDTKKVLKSFPCFVLVFNPGWNDFGRRTEFRLFYHDHGRNEHEIHKVKILSRENTTIEALPKEFTPIKR